MYYFPNFAIKKNKELWAPREGETSDVGKHGPTVKPVHWGDTQAFPAFQAFGSKTKTSWTNYSMA